MKIRQMVLLSLATMLVSAPAYATTTFAQYKQINETDTVAWSGGTLTDNGGATGSVVLFDFLGAMPAGADDPMEAYLNISAAGSPYGGIISFHRVSDDANLLTVMFTGAQLFTVGSSGALLDSQPGSGTIVYSSDFLDFTGSTAADFSLSFSAVTAAPNGGWTADSVGTFASDAQVGGDGGVVPEPATWALMIIGFGATGAMLRRRRLAFA